MNNEMEQAVKAFSVATKELFSLGISLDAFDELRDNAFSELIRQRQSELKKEKTLCQRINRRLRPNFQTVRKTRGDRHKQSLGDYYLLDTYQNAIIDTHVDLAALDATITEGRIQ